MAEYIKLSVVTDQLQEIFEDDFNLDEFLLGNFNEDAAHAAKLIFHEQEGGFEGGAESCHTVFSIGDVFYKINYSYYSHHGFDTEYAGAFIVTPVEQTVVVYQ
jgi:hypothetical protein